MRIQRVSGRVDVDARPQQAVVADANLADIEHHAVKVRIEILADMDVIAVITAEVRFDVIMFPGRSQEFLQQFLSLRIFGFKGLIVQPRQAAGTQSILDQFRISASFPKVVTVVSKPRWTYSVD